MYKYLLIQAFNKKIKAANLLQYLHFRIQFIPISIWNEIIYDKRFIDIIKQSF